MASAVLDTPSRFAASEKTLIVFACIYAIQHADAIFQANICHVAIHQFLWQNGEMKSTHWSATPPNPEQGTAYVHLPCEIRSEEFAPHILLDTASKIS